MKSFLNDALGEIRKQQIIIKFPKIFLSTGKVRFRRIVQSFQNFG